MITEDKINYWFYLAANYNDDQPGKKIPKWHNCGTNTIEVTNNILSELKSYFTR